MGREPRTIAATALSATAFAPFGWLPVADTDPADGDHRLQFAWEDPHVNVISHSREEMLQVAGAICCDKMFRHLSHTQALLVLDNPSVLAVAPPEVDFSEEGGIETVRAFRLAPHDSFVLHRGTWHWGPFPLGVEPVHLYNVQGLRYVDDNESADLTRFDLWVETDHVEDDHQA